MACRVGLAPASSGPGRCDILFLTPAIGGCAGIRQLSCAGAGHNVPGRFACSMPFLGRHAAGIPVHDDRCEPWNGCVASMDGEHYGVNVGAVSLPGCSRTTPYSSTMSVWSSYPSLISVSPAASPRLKRSSIAPGRMGRYSSSAEKRSA